MAISFIRSVRVGIACLTIVFLLVMGACGTGVAPESAASSESSVSTKAAPAPETTAAPEVTSTTGADTESGIFVVKEAVSTVRTQKKALVGCPEADLPPTSDTWSYARNYGLSREEADRRMDLQMCLSEDLYLLERNLKRNEDNSFAGLWIEHEPEYRFVVLFTESGQQTIQPYAKDEPYFPLLEVRSGAEATFAELRVAQNKAGGIADRLDLGAGSSLDVMRNRAELYTSNRDQFKAALQRAGLRIPEHVVLIESEPLPAS